jgi:hypothetical protein
MSLKENAQDTVRTRLVWLEQANRAMALVDDLPSELQALDGNADSNSDGDLSLSFYQYNNKDLDLLRVCKMAGVQGLSPKMYTPDNWTANGTMQIGKTAVYVHINGLPKPPTCVIEPYTETVTKYRAICTETGEEIK